MPSQSEQITRILSETHLPDGRDLLSAGAVHGLEASQGTVRFVLDHPALDGASTQGIAAALKQALAEVPGLDAVQILTPQPTGETDGDAAPPRLPGVRHIVFVGAGKGGVGKSTVTANLALALADLGLKVGVLDADVYGPSLPQMFGSDGRPVSYGVTLIPIAAHGIKLMSLGFMLAADQALIWRGPILANTLEQLLFEVRWAPLDILLIDLPPGTGDVPLTIAQSVEVSGAVVVSTPQDIALLDVRRALDLFSRTEVPVLGLVENMSVHVCDTCGAEDAVFGSGLGEFAKRQGMDLLARLPLARAICLSGEEGAPVVRLSPHSPAAKRFGGAARRLAQSLSLI